MGAYSKNRPITLKKWYRARLVAQAHQSCLRHVLHGNALTVILSSIRGLLGLAPVWNTSNSNCVALLSRDVTKAYLQGEKPPRDILYKPRPEFFGLYPQHRGKLFKASVLFYGEV